MGEDEYRDYMTSIIIQLKNCYPNSSFMVLNLMEGDRRIQILDILSQYDVKIVDYPRQYERYPILPLETIHDFLRTSDNWFSSEGESNMLLLHCERHGWPVLAFMLASLLLYRQGYTSEERTLEMAYRQAPKELLHVDSPLNPHPSYLRYLQYVTKLHSVYDWPLKDSHFILDCLILRSIPNFDSKGGCRPMLRIHSREPSTPKDRTSKILFSTLKAKRCSDGVSSPVKTPTPSSSSVGSARSDTRPVPSSPPLRALRASKEVVSPNGDRRSSSTSISPPSDASSSRASSASPRRRSGFAPLAPPPPRSKLSSGGALPSSPTRGGAPPASSPREASSPRAAAAAAATRVTRRFEKLLH